MSDSSYDALRASGEYPRKGYGWLDEEAKKQEITGYLQINQYSPWILKEAERLYIGNSAIIAGSRDYPESKELYADIHNFCAENLVTTIISGLAKGPDSYGIKYAQYVGLPVQTYPADWKTYGKKAGILRNEEMAYAANCLLAFWDGKSPGTKHMIRFAQEQGLIVKVIKLA